MTETIRTETHAFYIQPNYRDRPGFIAEYRPLNPKTGKPWQASRHIEDGADVVSGGYDRATAYSTWELAVAAAERQAAKLTKGRGKA